MFLAMADFNWDWPRKVDRDLIEEILRLGFMEESANVILAGPNGVGKTTIAVHLAEQDAAPSTEEQTMMIESRPFGKTQAGKAVTQFTCRNANGLVLEMIDYGATVTAMRVPDREGTFANIVLGCPDIAGYEACTSYFGCTVGRYCNRIAQGKFTIDGIEYSLATNNGPNHLHGGKVGFDKKLWTAEPIKMDDAVGVRFTLVSPDGDEGYPGTLTVKVTYLLTNDDVLVIDFKAETDKSTHVNLTNHNYWNLTGDPARSILDHELKIEADRYLPVDQTLIPTGEIATVESTPFDFRNFQTIGSRMDQLKSDPIGYDHCYVLRSQTGKVALAATVRDPASGRILEIHTTQPGVQFYSGNFLDESEGSGGYAQYHGFCLETQKYPDSPNHPEFPSTLLKPGETYHQVTIHRFKTAPLTR